MERRRKAWGGRWKEVMEGGDGVGGREWRRGRKQKAGISGHSGLSAQLEKNVRKSDNHDRTNDNLSINDHGLVLDGVHSCSTSIGGQLGAEREK